MTKTDKSGASKIRKVSSLEELHSALEQMTKNVVFRGQTVHHVDENGRVSMTTSFHREGCVPPLMLKWAQYADSVIRALQGPDLPGPPEGRTQAILQHYGWRSFYIDATNSPAVAAWFASHKFSKDVRAELCEDVYEEGVCLLTTTAKYSLSTEAVGHLYVISRDEVTLCGAKCDDLAQDIITEAGLRLRFLEQDACMLGLGDKGIPENWIVADYEVPVPLLMQYAKQAGFDKTPTLFPTPAEDPVLRLLLRSPWVRAPQDVAMPTFMQGLRLPMYSNNHQKHLPAAVALYSREWVDDPGRARRMPELKNALCIQVPDFFAYGQATGANCFPLLTEFLRKHGTVVIEVDGLFRYAERSEYPSYYKGVVLTVNSGVLSVCALTVEHPGTRLVAWGAELGWRYSISSSGEWVRAPSEADCPCNAPHRHEQFFCPIEKVEDALRDKGIQSKGPLSMSLAGR